MSGFVVCFAKCEPCQWGQHDGGCHCVKEPARAPSEDDFDMDAESLDATSCEDCGEVGACAFDAEGRPLIHATTRTTQALRECAGEAEEASE